MTPHEILAALRAAGCALRFGHGGLLHLFYLNGMVSLDKSLLAEFLAQRSAVADLLVRERLQPWQPARCVIGEEIDEMLASAWPDAEPDTLGLLRGPLQTAAVVASMRLLVLLAAEGRA